MKETKRISVIGAAIMDVVCGHVNGQILETGSTPVDFTRISFGGDALNEAVALAKLAGPGFVELISKVGRDAAGGQVVDHLQQYGVLTDGVAIEEGLTTGVNIVLVDESSERHFLTDSNGSLRRLAEEDVTPYVDGLADIVSFASMFVSPLLDIPAMKRLFEAIKAKPGRILAADMTKAKNKETLKDITCLLPYLDFLFPNESEIALLTGVTDPLRNAELLVEAGLSCAVIKCGAEGCVIKTVSETWMIPAYEDCRCIDTTGAGDSFAAGFLWALSQGMALPDCGRFANAVASCAVECAGATEGIASLQVVMQRYNIITEL